MVSTTLETLPAMDVAGRLPRLRERFATRASTRCSSPACRTSATSRGSPGRPGWCSSPRPTRARHRRPVQGPVRRADRRVRCRRRVGVGTTQRRQSEILREAAAGDPRLGLEAHGVSWAQQRAFGDWFPDARAGRRPSASSRTPDGQGPGRGRAGAGRVRHRRRRARGRPPVAARCAERAGLRAPVGVRDAGAGRERRQLRRDRRVGPERRQAARPAVRPRRSRPTSWSSSTSGASSTGTART